MAQIAQLFGRMDSWRHLPNYQLERRADPFFSLYLPDVLEEKLGFAVADDLIHEFPVRIGTIYPRTRRTKRNKSFKIDYLALSTDADPPLVKDGISQAISNSGVPRQFWGSSGYSHASRRVCSRNSGSTSQVMRLRTGRQVGQAVDRLDLLLAKLKFQASMTHKSWSSLLLSLFCSCAYWVQLPQAVRC